MTAVVFVVALVAAWINFETRGWYAFGSTTIYVAAFIAVLATAVFFALKAWSRPTIIGALVLMANFGLSHWGWTTEDKVTSQALIDIATAAYFILAGTTRWEVAVGAIYLISVGSAGFAYLDWIPGPNERPLTFLAWSYPDITSFCGHFAAITLGLGAGDWGSRVRARAAVKPRLVAVRHSAMAVFRRL